jgi:hypothetical protein
MKQIALKKLPGDDRFREVDYRITLMDVVRTPLNPQGGIGLDEMRRSVRVLEALEHANGTLELEDADFDHLKEKLQRFQWGIADRRILQLVDDVLG